MGKEEAMETLKKLGGVTAIVVAREKHKEADAEGGTDEHLHCMVLFEKKRRRKPELFNIGEYHANVQILRNIRNWITYITKEDKNPECWNYDVEAVLKKENPKLTAKMAAGMTAEELTERVHPRELQRTIAGAQLARMLTRKLEDLDGPCGIWIKGAAGVGKSFGVRKVFKGKLYLKDHNKWWDGYDGEETVLIDDVHMDSRFLVHFLKIWADAYPYNAETKGGMMRIRPKWIIVTSNYDLEDLGRTEGRQGEIKYMEPEDLAALRRRFREIEVKERGETERELREWIGDGEEEIAEPEPKRSPE